MKLLLNNKELDFLSIESSEGGKFLHYYSNDKRKFINCFVSLFEKNEDCLEDWKVINNKIALYFQAALDDDIAKWNIYLILITPSKLDKNIKYKIENDRFALRKILLSKEELGLDNNKDLNIVLKNRLEEIILGEDLILTSTENFVSKKQTENKLESNDFEIFRFNDYLIPLDGKESSIKIRRKHINDLLSRLED